MNNNVSDEMRVSNFANGSDMRKSRKNHKKRTNALSRRPPHSSRLLLVSTAQPTWLSTVDSYSSNTKVEEIMQQLVIQKTSRPPYQLINGLLKYNGTIWVGLVHALHLKIFFCLS